MNRRRYLLAVGVGALVVSACSEVARALCFGWVSFLIYVLPRVTVDWLGVAVGCTALLLFAAGVHAIGRRWGPRPTGESGSDVRRWRFRWSLAIVAVVFLLFATGIAVVAVTHQVAWLLTSREPLMVSTLKYSGRSSRTNLQLIGMAMRDYHDYKGRLPAGGTFMPDGSMLHSWETYLLPFVGYYGDIDLTRPWKDPRNAPRFKSIVPPFINPNLRTGELTDPDGYGLSHYAANERVLGGNSRMTFEGMTKGTATTLLVGEVNARFKPWGHPVNWRDPAKGINRSAGGFGGPRYSDGAQFLMADGSVHFISERVSPEVLRALATPTGTEEIDDSVLEPAR